MQTSVTTIKPSSTPEVSSMTDLDEHVDAFCFTLALALRRILDLEPINLDAEEDENWETLLEQEETA